MSDINDLRLKILDRAQLVIGERVGHRTAIDYRLLHHRAIMPGSVSVYVEGIKKTETSDYALDYATGKLAFVVALDDDDIVAADYEFATYSDVELQEFLDAADGSLATAAGNVLLALCTSQDRMICWARGDLKIDFTRLKKDVTDVAQRFLAQGESEPPVEPEDVNWEEIK